MDGTIDNQNIRIINTGKDNNITFNIEFTNNSNKKNNLIFID